MKAHYEPSSSTSKFVRNAGGARTRKSPLALVRTAVRDGVICLMVVLTFPLWSLTWLEKKLSSSEWTFATCTELLSLVPGRLGVFVRRAYYLMALDECAIDSAIGFGTLFAHRQTRLGAGVYIGNRCSIGSASIGDRCLIGSNVDILSGRHHHGFDDPTVPIKHQGGKFVQVRIGADCWIGNSSVIMADVGAGSVIGAGSVVVKPIPAGVVAAGNPCVVKRARIASETQEQPAEELVS